MNAAVTLLASLSALTYVAATAFVFLKRWMPQAGLGLLNALAFAAFAVERFVPGSEAAALTVSALTIAALLHVARRSSPPPAGVMAGIPLCVMLLVVDRPFFPPHTADEFQYATVALLCAAGPLAIISLLLGRSVSRTRSLR